MNFYLLAFLRIILFSFSLLLWTVPVTVAFYGQDARIMSTLTSLLSAVIFIVIPLYGIFSFAAEKIRYKKYDGQGNRSNRLPWRLSALSLLLAFAFGFVCACFFAYSAARLA